jgi:hypothetical protein
LQSLPAMLLGALATVLLRFSSVKYKIRLPL